MNEHANQAQALKANMVKWRAKEIFYNLPWAQQKANALSCKYRNEKRIEWCNTTFFNFCSLLLFCASSIFYSFYLEVKIKN